MVCAPSAEEAASRAAYNVRGAIPAVEAYHSDHGSYAGMNLAALRELDPALAPSFAIAWARRQLLRAEHRRRTDGELLRAERLGDQQELSLISSQERRGK